MILSQEGTVDQSSELFDLYEEAKSFTAFLLSYPAPPTSPPNPRTSSVSISTQTLENSVRYKYLGKAS